MTSRRTMKITAVTIPPCNGATPGPVQVRMNPAMVVVGSPAKSLDGLFRELADVAPATGEQPYIVYLPVRIPPAPCGLAISAGVLETAGVVPDGATSQYAFWGASDGKSVTIPTPDAEPDDETDAEPGRAPQAKAPPEPAFTGGARPVVCPTGTPGAQAKDIQIETIRELIDLLAGSESR